MLSIWSGPKSAVWERVKPSLKKDSHVPQMLIVVFMLIIRIRSLSNRSIRIIFVVFVFKNDLMQAQKTSIL